MYTEDYLMHYGTKGQKWGIRRYQNADGTLNDAGKARYREDGSKKTTDNMSNEELISANTRLNNEQNYNRMTGKGKVSSAAIKVGATFVGTFLAVAGTKAIKNYFSTKSANKKSGSTDKVNFFNKDSLKSAGLSGVLSASVASVVALTSSVGGNVGQDITNNGNNKKDK